MYWFLTVFWGEGIICGVEAQHRDSYLGQFVTRTRVLVIIDARLVAKHHRCEALVKLTNRTCLDTEIYLQIYHQVCFNHLSYRQVLNRKQESDN